MYIHLHTTYWTRQTVNRNQDLLLQQLLNWKRDGKMASETFVQYVLRFCKNVFNIAKMAFTFSVFNVLTSQIANKNLRLTILNGVLKTFVKLMYKSMIWSSVTVSNKTMFIKIAIFCTSLYREWMSRPYFT